MIWLLSFLVLWSGALAVLLYVLRLRLPPLLLLVWFLLVSGISLGVYGYSGNLSVGAVADGERRRVNELRAALALSPQLLSARLALVEFYVRSDDLQGALELLHAVPDSASEDDRARVLRLRSMIEAIVDK